MVMNGGQAGRTWLLGGPSLASASDGATAVAESQYSQGAWLGMSRRKKSGMYKEHDWQHARASAVLLAGLRFDQIARHDYSAW